jgi:hypothetical protein
MNNIFEMESKLHFPFYDTFLYWGLWRIIQAKCNYRMSVEIMLNAVNLLFVAFLLITKMHKDKFSFLSMAVLPSCRRFSHSSFDI